MATSMSSNKLVWVGVALLAILVGVAIINSANSPDPLDEPKNAAVTKAGSAKPKAKSKNSDVSVDGDTIVESQKELSAQYSKLQKENIDLKKELDDQSRDIKILKDKAANSKSPKADPLVEDALQKVDEMKRDFSQLAASLQKKDAGLGGDASGYEVNGEDLGWSDEIKDASGKTKKTFVPHTQSLPGYVTIKPLTKSNDSIHDVKSSSLLKKAGSLKFTEKNSTGEKSEIKTALKKSGVEKAFDNVTPYYTIPARATLTARAMSALIGTVPLGGKISDPFDAKFIVGEDALATNGLYIPGLKGIVFEGKVRGNWNLSCNAVTLIAGTYTFADGRIQHLTFNQKQAGGGSRSAQAESPFAETEASRGIGYIMNPQGVPCIPGKRVTDAEKQLLMLGLLGAGRSYFDAKAAAETTSSENILGGATTSVTGDKSAFINNKTYSNAISAGEEFYSKRFRDTFDSIYTDPGEEVSINITQDLFIDYHSEARKLVYFNGGSNGKSMD